MHMRLFLALGDFHEGAKCPRPEAAGCTRPPPSHCAHSAAVSRRGCATAGHSPSLARSRRSAALPPASPRAAALPAALARAVRGALCLDSTRDERRPTSGDLYTAAASATNPSPPHAPLPPLPPPRPRKRIGSFPRPPSLGRIGGRDGGGDGGGGDGGGDGDVPEHSSHVSHVSDAQLRHLADHDAALDAHQPSQVLWRPEHGPEKRKR